MHVMGMAYAYVYDMEKQPFWNLNRKPTPL